MRVVGIDGAAKVGTAWKDASGRWQTRTVAAADTDGLSVVLREAKADGCELAAIEGCFLGVNANTFRSLSAVQGRIALLCEFAGLPTRIVQPITWKSAVLMTSGYFPKDRRGQKEASAFAARALGATCRTEHEADAVCLAHYAEHNGQQLTLDLRPSRKPRPSPALLALR